MNNTKWNEIFRAFYENECKDVDSVKVFYRTKTLQGYISDWESMWERFGCEFKNCKQFEWLQIQLTESNRCFVINTLKRIHIPGEMKNNIVTIYGYRQDCDYF